MSSWTPALIINRSVVREMVTHMVKQSPREMCGLLLSRKGTLHAVEFRALANMHNDPERRYYMNPETLVNVYEYANRSDLTVLGVVHSHPREGASAYPSKTDVEMAVSDDVIYVILSREPRQINAFRIGDGSYDGVPVLIENSKPGLDYCYVCGQYEDSLRAFRVCFECNHVYKTAQDLLDAHNKILDEVNSEELHFWGSEKPVKRKPIPHVTNVEEVYSCPLCIHDF